MHPVHIEAERLPSVTDGGDVFGSAVRRLEIPPVNEEHHSATIALLPRAERLREGVLTSGNRRIGIDERDRPSLSLGDLGLPLEQQMENALVTILPVAVPAQRRPRWLELGASHPPLVYAVRNAMPIGEVLGQLESSGDGTPTRCCGWSSIQRGGRSSSMRD